jgi:hypothetical protein
MDAFVIHLDERGLWSVGWGAGGRGHGLVARERRRIEGRQTSIEKQPLMGSCHFCLFVDAQAPVE